MIGAEMSEDVGEVLLVAVHYFSYVLHVVPDILVSSVFALFQSCIFISASPPQNYVIGSVGQYQHPQWWSPTTMWTKIRNLFSVS
jgi:hypothetical protein